MGRVLHRYSTWTDFWFYSFSPPSFYVLSTQLPSMLQPNQELGIIMEMLGESLSHCGERVAWLGQEGILIGGIDFKLLRNDKDIIGFNSKQIDFFGKVIVFLIR